MNRCMSRVPNTASKRLLPYVTDLLRRRAAERQEWLDHSVLGPVPIIGHLDGPGAQALLDGVSLPSDPDDGIAPPKEDPSAT